MRSPFRCWYCHNDDYPGCDCGACDCLYHGSSGYHWCVRFGCRACGNKRAWPWRRVFWQGIGVGFWNHMPVGVIEWWDQHRRAAPGEGT
jgi:hypothetical protein